MRNCGCGLYLDYGTAKVRMTTRCWACLEEVAFEEVDWDFGLDDSEREVEAQSRISPTAVQDLARLPRRTGRAAVVEPS